MGPTRRGSTCCRHRAEVADPLTVGIPLQMSKAGRIRWWGGGAGAGGSCSGREDAPLFGGCVVNCLPRRRSEAFGLSVLYGLLSTSWGVSERGVDVGHLLGEGVARRGRRVRVVVEQGILEESGGSGLGRSRGRIGPRQVPTR